MKFIVDIPPTGKARPRMTRGGHVYTPKATTDAEAAIRAIFCDLGGETIPKDVPVSLEVVAYFPIPKSWSDERKWAASRGDIYPTKKPDADNILKLVADALNGSAYEDDAQVIKMTAWKQFSRNGLGYIAINVNRAFP